MEKHIEKIQVDLPTASYPIYIGEDLLENKNLLQKHIRAKQVMLVSNETIAPLYLPKIKEALDDYQCHEIILPDGEAYKNLSTWQKILEALAKHHHHRDTTLIAVGGGVIGDIAGFAAACYQRGISFIQIPTTLLAQVDASIGGKTAINHSQGKNLIGAFHQPSAVIIDVNTLTTLPDREFKAGIAEIIKAALICDPDFFLTIEKNISKFLLRSHDTLIAFIKRACEIKRDIVIADEKETLGKRALLNLGHTFAHAIEHELGYGKWLHGEAVAAGLSLAAELSYNQNLLSASETKKIKNLLAKVPLPTHLPNTTNINALIKSMNMDKKIEKNQLRFILLKDIGNAIITTDISNENLRKLLQNSLQK